MLVHRHLTCQSQLPQGLHHPMSSQINRLSLLQLHQLQKALSAKKPVQHHYKSSPCKPHGVMPFAGAGQSRTDQQIQLMRLSTVRAQALVTATRSNCPQASSTTASSCFLKCNLDHHQLRNRVLAKPVDLDCAAERQWRQVRLQHSWMTVQANQTQGRPLLQVADSRELLTVVEQAHL